MERSQSEKDEELWTAFNALANKNPEGRLAQIQWLVEEGATTAYFEDYELGRYNFASAVRDFLEGRFSNQPGREQDLLRCLHLLLHVGRAPWTNRSYVGNGGVPAIWWCYDDLGQLVGNRRSYRDRRYSAEKLQRVFSLVSRMTEMTLPEDPAWEVFLDGFWGNFVPSLRSLNRLEKEEAAVVKSFIDHGLECTFHKVGIAYSREYWFGDHSTPISDAYHPITRSLQALVDSQSHEHLSQVLGYFEKSAGILKDVSLSPAQQSSLLNNILGVFLRSRESRQLAVEFIQRSKWLRTVLAHSVSFCFSVVKKRERGLLKALLKHESRVMRGIRDAEGRSLLLHACAHRGRNEKLIQLLIDYEFDPLLLDSKGLNAISLARANKKDALARLMETR